MLLLLLAVLAVAAAYEWATRRTLGPDPGLRPERRRQARPIAVHGCFGCALYAIDDDHLAAHLARDHAA